MSALAQNEGPNMNRMSKMDHYKKTVALIADEAAAADSALAILYPDMTAPERRDLIERANAGMVYGRVEIVAYAVYAMST